MMSGTVEDVIRVAEGEIGKSDGNKYFSYFGAKNLGAWCVAGARWCYAVADVDCHWHASFQAFDWRDVPSKYAVRPKDLKRGDFVAFDWPDDEGYDGKGDHVGIVTGVYDWGITTIEFNTDWGVVAKKQRVWEVVICGIRPTYKTSEGQWRKSGERWWYAYNGGGYPKGELKEIDGQKYYFDADGWMVTGWAKAEGAWRYFDKTKGSVEGRMLKSTVINDGTGYYIIDKDGAMVTNPKTNSSHDGTFGRIVF